MSAIDRPVLEARMREQGLEPVAWSSPPGDVFEPHIHDYDKVVVVAGGTITFGMSGHPVGFVLGPGERLDLPAAVRHDAVVGPKGVACLEAHLPAGALGIRAKGRGHLW